MDGRAIDILLIEDNPGDIRLTKECLREGKVRNNLFVIEDGFMVMPFLRSEEEFANTPHPDLILLDLNLPGRDGREILKDIKNDPEFKKIPIVILTSSQDEKDVLQAYDLYVNCYITKPVDLDQFINVVKSIESFWLIIVQLPSRAITEEGF
jgi:two-component system, chemotaxis family, response regulator Rcp1